MDSREPAQRRSTRTMPIVLGAAALLVVAVIAFLAGRGSSGPEQAPGNAGPPGRAASQLPANLPNRDIKARALHFFSFDDGSTDLASAGARGGAVVVRDVSPARPAAEAVGCSFIAQGAVGGAVGFGDSRSRVGVRDSAQHTPAAFSVCAWIKRTGREDGTIVDKADWKGGPTRGYVLRVIRDRIDFSVGADTWHSLTSSAPLPMDQWVHVAATFDGKTGRIYVNGAPDAYGPLPSPVNPSTYPVVIGNGTYEEASGRVLRGLADEVGVFAEALGPQDVKRLFGERKP
jgi:hypothetical protein